MYCVCCIFRLGRNFLDHERISKDKALDLMINYLGDDLKVALREFEFLKKGIYTTTNDIFHDEAFTSNNRKLRYKAKERYILLVKKTKQKHIFP